VFVFAAAEVIDAYLVRRLIHLHFAHERVQRELPQVVGRPLRFLRLGRLVVDDDETLRVALETVDEARDLELAERGGHPFFERDDVGVARVLDAVVGAQALARSFPELFALGIAQGERDELLVARHFLLRFSEVVACRFVGAVLRLARHESLEHAVHERAAQHRLTRNRGR